MTSKAPAFQFYPKDWLSSLQVLMMTPEQEGAYIRLLCYCWDSGDCSLPEDDQKLAIMSRLGEKWFNQNSTTLKNCFIPHPTKKGFLTNKKLLDQVNQFAAWREKSSIGGKKSAAKRAELKKISNGGLDLLGTKSNPATATASATASAKEEIKQRMFYPEWLPSGDFEDWLKQKKKKLKPRAIELAILKLDDYRKEGHDPAKVLQQSIMNGWEGLFELKNESRTGQSLMTFDEKRRVNNEKAEQEARKRYE